MRFKDLNCAHMSWTRDQGVTVTTKPVTLTSQEAILSHSHEMAYLTEQITNFEFDCWEDELNLPTLGLHKETALARHPLMPGWDALSVTPWIAVPIDTIEIGTPCVAVAQRREDNRMFVILASIGFPPPTDQWIPITTPHNEMRDRIVNHVNRNPEHSRVEYALADPDALNEAQERFAVEQFNQHFTEAFTKTDHVPYTRIGRLLNEAQQQDSRQGHAPGTYPLHIEGVFAIDTDDTNADRLISPVVAVVARNFRPATNNDVGDRVAHILNEDGWVEVNRTTHTRRPLIVSFWAKTPEKFQHDSADAWFHHHADTTTSWHGRNLYRHC